MVRLNNPDTVNIKANIGEHECSYTIDKTTLEKKKTSDYPQMEMFTFYHWVYIATNMLGVRYAMILISYSLSE